MITTAPMPGGTGPDLRASADRTVPGGRSLDDLWLVVATPICAGVVVAGMGPLLLRAIAGLFLLVILPVQLLTAKVTWPRGVPLREAWLLSLATVLLGIMLVGLALNAVLPVFGIMRPLDRGPVVATLLIALAALAVWRRHRWRWRDGLAAEERSHNAGVVGWRDQYLVVCSAVLVVGSLAGAIRLNNGLDGSMSTATLILIAGALLALGLWRRVLNELTIALSIFLLCLSLLFMTSMRGWNIAGHDIQREFGMLELVTNNGVWSMSAFQDAYNACLSITILPAIVARVTGIPDLYVFKIVFQILFALCAVIVYLVARRFGSRTVAVIATLYFLPFPVCFSDMPYLNRQEVAFFFVGVLLLLMTNGAVPVRMRRVGLVVLGGGVLLSHYSTTYVLLGVLMLAWAIGVAVRVVRVPAGRLWTGGGRPRERSRSAGTPMVLNWAVIAALALCTFAWVGPATHTASELDKTFTSTLKSLTGGGDGARSSTTSFSILGGEKLSPEAVLKKYEDESLERTEYNRGLDQTYPRAELDKYSTPYVPFETVPIGLVGEAAQGLGLDIANVKHTVAWGLARATQLFIAFGFLLVLLGRARGFRPSSEFAIGAAACIIAVAANTLLPVVSTKYDVGRTFLQALFWLAPFWAVGSIQAFGWLGRTRSIRVGLSLALVFFAVASNIITQISGGEPPAMQLNNAGPAYYKYYVQDQDVAAIKWLERRFSETLTSSVQAETFTGIYSYSDLRPEFEDIFPAEIRKDAYVFLNDATTRTEVVTVFADGDNVSYRYPLDFLDANKNLIFSSAGSRIYG